MIATLNSAQPATRPVDAPDAEATCTVKIAVDAIDRRGIRGLLLLGAATQVPASFADLKHVRLDAEQSAGCTAIIQAALASRAVLAVQAVFLKTNKALIRVSGLPPALLSDADQMDAAVSMSRWIDDDEPCPGIQAEACPGLSR